MSVILPKSIIESSPSSLDNVSKEEEKLRRIFGCELIQEAGILLRVQQVVIITAQNVFHRFFYRKSLKRFDEFSVAMACLFLASKVEEKFKPVREVLFIFHSIFMRRNKLKLKPLELGGKLYNDWKNQLVFTERYILKELGFSLYSTMDHPHKYILYFVKLLSGSNKLSQTAWNYLNDSSRLDLGLRYPARDLACASIYMAARLIEFPLPHNPPWWSVMADDIDRIYEVCEEILSVYNVPETTWLDGLTTPQYLKDVLNEAIKDRIASESLKAKEIPVALEEKSNEVSTNKVSSKSPEPSSNNARLKKDDRNTDKTESHNRSSRETVLDDNKISERRNNKLSRNEDDDDQRSDSVSGHSREKAERIGSRSRNRSRHDRCENNSRRRSRSRDDNDYDRRDRKSWRDGRERSYRESDRSDRHNRERSDYGKRLDNSRKSRYCHEDIKRQDSKGLKENGKSRTWASDENTECKRPRDSDKNLKHDDMNIQADHNNDNSKLLNCDEDERIAFSTAPESTATCDKESSHGDQKHSNHSSNGKCEREEVPKINERNDIRSVKGTHKSFSPTDDKQRGDRRLFLPLRSSRDSGMRGRSSSIGESNYEREDRNRNQEGIKK